MTTLTSSKTSQTPKISKKTVKPIGKKLVMAALIQAASELFSKVGPDSISVRDVAAKANVNHALVHRHFGSKENLLQVVLNEHADAFRLRMKNESDFSKLMSDQFETSKLRPSFTLIIAQLVLSGRQPNTLLSTKGGHAKLLEIMLNDETIIDKETAKIDIAAASALTLGWRLFGPFIMESLDVDEITDDMEDHIKNRVKELGSYIK